MVTDFENKVQLGIGVYTMRDIANILRIDYHKVRVWLREYWDKNLGKHFEEGYSWQNGHNPAVSFQTLVELYVFMQLTKAGVQTHKILEGHKVLSEIFNTKFPFANMDTVKGIRIDRKKIYFENKNKEVFSLDSSKQFKLEFIKLFFGKIDFENNLAARLWPLGKKKSVVIDPHHQFGMPVIASTNIQTQCLYNLYLAKEPTKFIASLYEVDEKQVKDAINFHKSAA